MTAGRQTPSPLHLLFLTQALAVPAGLKPHGRLAMINLHLCEQQGPPSHSSDGSFTPLPHCEVAVFELVPVLEADLDEVAVPV